MLRSSGETTVAAMTSVGRVGRVSEAPSSGLTRPTRTCEACVTPRLRGRACLSTRSKTPRSRVLSCPTSFLERKVVPIAPNRPRSGFLPGYLAGPPQEKLRPRPPALPLKGVRAATPSPAITYGPPPPSRKSTCISTEQPVTFCTQHGTVEHRIPRSRFV